MSHDYFREIDLNPPPALGGPINNPLDPRAQSDFCFLSDSQEITLVTQQTAATPVRVLVSFECGHQALLNQPMLPPGMFPVHGVLVFDPAFPQNPDRLKRTWHCCHNRRFLKTWIDPTGPQPIPGQPVIVLVAASAKGCKDEPCC